MCSSLESKGAVSPYICFYNRASRLRNISVLGPPLVHADSYCKGRLDTYVQNSLCCMFYNLTSGKRKDAYNSTFMFNVRNFRAGSSVGELWWLKVG